MPECGARWNRIYAAPSAARPRRQTVRSSVWKQDLAAGPAQPEAGGFARQSRIAVEGPATASALAALGVLVAFTGWTGWFH
jgi:hypothetical protein